MDERHWGDEPDSDAIRAHLARQADLDPLEYVRLDTGEIRPVGGTADNGDADGDH